MYGPSVEYTNFLNLDPFGSFALEDLGPDGGLILGEEGLDEGSGAAGGHGGEPLEPVAVCDGRVRIEPGRKGLEIARVDFAGLNAVQKVVEDGWRKIGPLNFGHRGKVTDAIRP